MKTADSLESARRLLVEAEMPFHAHGDVVRNAALAQAHAAIATAEAARRIAGWLDILCPVVIGKIAGVVVANDDPRVMERKP